MSHALVFRDDASLELEEAHDWYAARRVGLGDEFLAEVDALLLGVAMEPERFPVVFGVIRHALVHRFPYVVYFRVVDESTVRILAVFHARRHPSIWKQRA